MTIELTPQTIITAGAVLSAALAIGTAVAKLVRWVDRQKKQDEEQKALRQLHKKDTEELHDELVQDNARVNEELTLLTYGILACLKGLKEQGCNGPVSEAINKIEKHLNKAAHDTGA